MKRFWDHFADQPRRGDQTDFEGEVVAHEGACCRTGNPIIGTEETD
jgi:hypothetical protein